MDYKEKIKKLLALAVDADDHEAKQALLKAREIMAREKLTEGDLEDTKSSEIIQIEMKDIQFSTRKDAWVSTLCSVLASYFPVCIFASRCKGKITNHVRVCGFPNDVEVVTVIIRYVYDSIEIWTKNIARENKISKGAFYSKIKKSFGYGFSVGMNTAYEEQNEQHQNWELALSAPDVSSVIQSTGQYEEKKSPIDDIIPSVFSAGTAEGYNYATTKRLQN